MGADNNATVMLSLEMGVWNIHGLILQLGKYIM